MVISTENQQFNLDEVIQAKRELDVPNFFEENESEIIYVPVVGGNIKVFHHKPAKPQNKRPIVFLPGFGTSAYSWREFHHTHHNFVEYYHIETRDKKSAEIKRTLRTDLTIDQIARDIAEVIDHIKLSNKDYVLMGTCMNGGTILHGLIEKILNPPTAVVFDPFTKWTQNRFLVKFIMPIIPPLFLDSMKYVIARIVMRGMDNEAQKRRNMENMKDAVGWKWRKFSLQNVNYDLTDGFKDIDQEVFIFHGPKDKYHPDGTFRKVAQQIPKGRFFYMNTSAEYRELLAGIIATEFALVSKNDGVPSFLQQYEIQLRS